MFFFGILLVCFSGICCQGNGIQTGSDANEIKKLKEEMFKFSKDMMDIKGQLQLQGGHKSDDSKCRNELNHLTTLYNRSRNDLINIESELRYTNDKLQKTVDRLEQIEKVVSDCKEDKTDSKASSQKRFLDNSYIALESNLQELTATVARLKTDVSNLRSKQSVRMHSFSWIKEIDNTSTIKVGFTAILSKDIVNLGDNQVIPFDRVYTNFGNNYNPLTGIFTCNVPGLYAFYVHTLAEPGKHLETEITKNLNVMAQTYAYDKDTFSSGSNMAVMDLQKGDTVLVRSHGHYSDHDGAVMDFFYSSFSGFLIQESK